MGIADSFERHIRRQGGHLPGSFDRFSHGKGGGVVRIGVVGGGVVRIGVVGMVWLLDSRSVTVMTEYPLFEELLLVVRCLRCSEGVVQPWCRGGQPGP